MNFKTLSHTTFRKIFKYNTAFYMLLLLVFCLPLNKKTYPYIIACITLNWLLCFNYRETYFSIVKSKFILLFIALFISYLVGIIYSQDINYARNDILLKLSFLIFPIVLFETLHFSWNQNKYILVAFIIGCFIACLVCLVHSYTIFLQTPDPQFFFYSKLSYIHHPGYFAMYLNFANAFLIFITFLSPIKPSKNLRILLTFLILFFTVFITFLNSKTGVIGSFLVFLFSIVSYYLQSKNILILIGYSFGIVLFFLAVQNYISKPLYPRFDIPQKMIQREVTNKVKSNLVIDKQTTESTNIRILIWKTSIEIIKENFLFGVGTGDVKDILLEKYKEKGMTGAYEEKLNAHNQYFQTFIALGLPGIMILLSSFIFPFILAFKKKNFLYVVFLFIVFLNFLTESMLETIAGVLFYAFFNSFLMINVNRKELSIES